MINDSEANKARKYKSFKEEEASYYGGSLENPIWNIDNITRTVHSIALIPRLCVPRQRFLIWILRNSTALLWIWEGQSVKPHFVAEYTPSLKEFTKMDKKALHYISEYVPHICKCCCKFSQTP